MHNIIRIWLFFLISIILAAICINHPEIVELCKITAIGALLAEIAVILYDIKDCLEKKENGHKKVKK
jgi:hypothetical protein